jgi:type I restriction-modification system DNA methylase subunit
MATVRTWASSYLWAAADKLRRHVDAAEYKHVVLGLIFLKYISDAFEARREQLLAGVAHGADPEDVHMPDAQGHLGPESGALGRLFWVCGSIGIGHETTKPL